MKPNCSSLPPCRDDSARRLSPPRAPEDARPRLAAGQSGSFDALDANKDGRISMPEASADPELVENFSTADKNGDGYLDNAEFDEPRPKPKQ